jgi:hypothetical protein
VSTKAPSSSGLGELRRRCRLSLAARERMPGQDGELARDGKRNGDRTLGWTLRGGAVGLWIGLALAHRNRVTARGRKLSSTC